MRYAVKAAPSPSGDAFEFVMSDSSVDRMGDVIEASGWDLSNFRDHSPALFNHDRNAVIGRWENVRVKGRQLLGRLVLAEEGTSALVDTVRKLITQKILRAVSVGFRPLEKETLTDEADPFWGPFRFIKQELLEGSIVAVPANPNALAVARSFGLSPETLRTVFSKPANWDGSLESGRQPASLPNASGRKAGTMNTISQRIESAQRNLLELRDRLQALIAQDERNEAEETEFMELTDELDGDGNVARPGRISLAQRSLNAWLAAEKALPKGTVPAVVMPGGDTLPAEPRAPMVTAARKRLEPRDLIYRAATAHFLARVQRRGLDEILRERYPGDEVTPYVAKAAVAPAQTTVAGWAAELVQTAIGDYLAQLALVSIYPRLAARGSKFTFGRNGIIKVPARTATPKINGSFVGEGAPIPVRKLGLASITLTPKKMAVISEFTREMGEHSTPAIEGIIRDSMNEDTAEAIDTVLIDTNVADAIRPAGLRAGVSGLTPSGATAKFDKIVADFQALQAPIIAARGGRDFVVLMNTAQALSLSWVATADGTFVFEEVNNGTLRNMTAIASTTVPAGMLIMVDAADFTSVTGDSPQFDVSDVATIHEEDTTPLPIGTPGAPAVVAAPVRSLWQTDSIGIRMILPMNWAMRRAGMVSWMTGVTW